MNFLNLSCKQMISQWHHGLIQWDWERLVPASNRHSGKAEHIALPRASSPGRAEGCWGFLQPTHLGFLCLGGHLGMNLGSKKDPWAPQDKHNGESLFFCGGIPGGDPKATGQKWIFERLLRWRRALSSHPIAAPELLPTVWPSEPRLIPNQSLRKIWFVLA